jgi:phosphoglycerate-specific signal transduction histidine kinase
MSGEQPPPPPHSPDDPETRAPNTREHATKRDNTVQSDQLRQAVPTIAHELSEAMTAIANYLEASRQLLGQAEAAWVDAVRSALGKAHAQTIRAATVIKQLRDIADADSPDDRA